MLNLHHLHAFPVERDTSCTTQSRTRKNLVKSGLCDCAAKSHGISLNDHLLQGPDFVNDLVGVLIRFRQEPVAVCGDIKQMFHQVMVSPEDRDALRFLWWPGGDTSKAPQVYRMCVHVFGATSSPSCCTFALRESAESQWGSTTMT